MYKRQAPAARGPSVLAEIARLRAENAELRAANERLSPVAAPAPPARAEASLDDLPPLVDAPPAEAPPSVRASLLAPAANSSLTARAWPFPAANSSAVKPSSSWRWKAETRHLWRKVRRSANAAACL